ncbi:MAG TPA: hypothetical protein VGJ02_04830 [Pyrinomonadaceae bacterium]|jgi:hypothetical protein
MLKLLIPAATIFLLALSAFGQGKSNDAINRQIRSLGIEKSITDTFDPSGNSSKLMAVTENFAYHETDRAGIEAMNMASGFFYPGSTLTAAPARLLFTFWCKTRKPRFADNHKLTIELAGGRTIDIGDARYSPRPRDDMEYLNFEITPSDLAALASAAGATFHLGAYTFTLTPQQQKVLRALTRVADASVAD